MNYIEQEIVLKSDSPYGHGIPLIVSSSLLRRLESTARPSVRILLEGSSASVGASPAWLIRATDIRTLGFSTKQGSSILHVKAPTLGDAVPHLFEQQALWPTPASPADTALRVMGKIAAAVCRQQVESDLYERSLLKHYNAWSGLFKLELKSVEFPRECPT